MIIEVLIGIWVFWGILYMLFSIEKWQLKPTHVGDLVIRVFFLPHSALMYLIIGGIYLADKCITPIINSKWWNKSL